MNEVLIAKLFCQILWINCDGVDFSEFLHLQMSISISKYSLNIKSIVYLFVSLESVKYSDCQRFEKYLANK